MSGIQTITLCGSMKFSSQMLQLQSKLQARGFKVHVPDISENKKIPFGVTEAQRREIKKGFIQQHFAKIQTSDAILVANFENKGIKGYIGSNTLMEIAVAYAYGKKVYVLHPLGEQNCREEVEALTTQTLAGDVSLIPLK